MAQNLALPQPASQVLPVLMSSWPLNRKYLLIWRIREAGILFQQLYIGFLRGVVERCIATQRNVHANIIQDGDVETGSIYKSAEHVSISGFDVSMLNAHHAC